MATSDKKNCFTIMVIPHSEEATYSLKLPFYILQLAVGLFIFLVAGVSLLGFAYLRAAATAREAVELRQINRAQQEEIDALAVETQRMLEQIQTIDELLEMVSDQMELEDLGSGNEEGVLLYRDSNNINQSEDGEAENFSHNRAYGSRSAAGGVIERTAENLAFLKSILPETTETADIVEEYISLENAKPSIWPTRGRLSSGFGMRSIPYARSGYQFHTGVDIIGAYGSSVWATSDGVVTFTGYRSSLGNLVIIDHGYGYETYYAHLSSFAVSVGDSVERGQTIAYMGASGRTTGTHLHYEVHYKGKPVNPSNYMNE